jgi:hypothetical protein
MYDGKVKGNDLKSLSPAGETMIKALAYFVIEKELYLFRD